MPRDIDVDKGISKGTRRGEESRRFSEERAMSDDENRKSPLFDRTFNRDAPQVAYQDVPDYYEGQDIPHVLARIRAFDRFFSEVVEKQTPEVYQALHIAFIHRAEKELQPYAFNLAISLISLEDSLSMRDDSQDEMKDMTTTARLIASLDVIRYEVGRMDTAAMDAKEITRSDRSTLKRKIAALAASADELIEWLSDQRLETPKN